MTPYRQDIFQARKLYSNCANRVESQIRQLGLSQSLSDKVIGLGVACDWLRKAAEMEDIEYVGKQLNHSAHKPSFTELLRYGFSWFALNAIFTRTELLGILGQPSSTSEYDRFLVLYGLGPIPNEQNLLGTLHGILATPTAPRLPSQPAGTSVTTIDAICRKYLPRSTHGRVAKRIFDAASTNQITTLDLPSLIYAFRNWSVHGNALEGSFGSRPRFVEYVAALHSSLAAIHVNTAKALQQHL